MLRVGVEVFLPFAPARPEDLQVAEHMDDHETNERQARDGDDPFPADGGIGEGEGLSSQTRKNARAGRASTRGLQRFEPDGGGDLPVRHR